MSPTLECTRTLLGGFLQELDYRRKSKARGSFSENLNRLRKEGAEGRLGSWGLTHCQVWAEVAPLTELRQEALPPSHPARATLPQPPLMPSCSKKPR